MKRFKAILLCLVLSFMAFGAMGCDDKDGMVDDKGFVEVMSVSYSGNKLESEIVFKYENWTEITKEEFEQLAPVSNTQAILRDKSNLKHDKKIGEFYGDCYYTGYPYDLIYRKAKLAAIKIQYVSVKIASDRAIYIKDHEGNITYKIADSITIEYFNA